MQVKYKFLLKINLKKQDKNLKQTVANKILAILHQFLYKLLFSLLAKSWYIYKSDSYFDPHAWSLPYITLQIQMAKVTSFSKLKRKQK